MSGTVGQATAPANQLCYGPYSLPTVLPALLTTTSQLTQTQASASFATSMCTGSYPALWHWNNQLVQTNSTANLTASSWLTVYGQYATGGVTFVGQVFTPPTIRKTKRIVAAEIRAGRRVLRRSIDLYARFRGLDEARRFINFEPIVWEGQRNNYRAQRRGSKLRETNHTPYSLLRQAMHPQDSHTPYNLTLLDKETGEALATGCILFDGLPIFDQMLAFWMGIQTERDEARMLSTVNWTFVAPGARERHLRQRVERHFDAEIARGMGSRRAERRRAYAEIAAENDRLAEDRRLAQEAQMVTTPEEDRRIEELTRQVTALAANLEGMGQLHTLVDGLVDHR